MRRLAQREFTFHGGRRPGAGRKRGDRVSHHPRPSFARVTPAIVTVKVKQDVPSLRSSRRFAAIRQAFVAARGLHGLRIVEFSVLGEHLHLVVEADDGKALSRGMQGVLVRIAVALNRLLGRRGGVFADHYHSRLLHSPTEVCAAIRYVLANAEHHFGERGVDSCSSSAPHAASALAVPEGWLLRAGWRRGRWPRQGPPPDSRYAIGAG
jgi:REP element-mobilizing transposase RayT